MSRASSTRTSRCRSEKSISARPSPTMVRSRPTLPSGFMIAPAHGVTPLSLATSSTGCRRSARNGSLARGDIDQVSSSYKPIAGRSDASIPPTLQRKPLRARPGKAVTQLRYAREGIITPEMEFIAVRENLGREQDVYTHHASRISVIWAANPSARASPTSSRPSSSALKWPGAAPSSRPTSITRRASR